MLAERYAVRVGVSSSVILVTTILSTITIATWLSYQMR